MKNYRVGYATGRRVHPKGKYQKPQKGQPQSERIHPKGKYQKPQPGQPQSKPQPLKKGGTQLTPEQIKRKKDHWKRNWKSKGPLPKPQLKKSQKERREELRKKARKSGGHSKIVFADEWDKIDSGLQKGLFKKEKRRSVRPQPLDKLKRLPLTVKEKTDPRRIKKLKRKKYDLKYSPGPGKATLEKRYQEPLDKRFSREQGPGAPPIREQGPGAPPIPSPQDPKHFKEIPPRFAGGGKALRGLGRAFVKGGKV